jgi:K+-transporting ATPase A subunit
MVRQAAMPVKTIHLLTGRYRKRITRPGSAIHRYKTFGYKRWRLVWCQLIAPFENPNYLTNITEIVSQMIIPIAMVLCFGYFIRRKKLGWVIFGVMMIGALLLLIPSIGSETGGNPAIAKMGISQVTGAMEGKEVRIGPTATAFWSTFTTIVSTGSVNGMHDSTMPLPAYGSCWV